MLQVSFNAALDLTEGRLEEEVTLLAPIWFRRCLVLAREVEEITTADKYLIFM